MKSILSVVPAPKKSAERERPGRALPIEFVELSRTESYGYLMTVWLTDVRRNVWQRDDSVIKMVTLHLGG